MMICGTCPDHFKLLDKKQMAKTTNMLDIVKAMRLATRSSLFDRVFIFIRFDRNRQQ
jgi:hypothetical protein